MMVNKAMIFAAGRGTRMKDLTTERPKPLIEVAGRPLIDHALSLTDGLPIKKIVVNAHYRADQLKAHLRGRNLAISHEQDQLLETGGGLKFAQNLLGDGAVFTLNSDAVWTGSNPLHCMQRAWNPQQMDGLLMLVRPENVHGHKGRGDFLLGSDQRLIRGEGFIYSGCQIINNKVVNAWPEDVFSLNPVWDDIIANQRLFGIVHDGNWCDVGHPEGIKIAENMLGDGHV